MGLRIRDKVGKSKKGKVKEKCALVQTKNTRSIVDFSMHLCTFPPFIHTHTKEIF